jgi:hypothetical protein
LIYNVTGLVKGKIYRFVSRATNFYGDSIDSLELIAGVGSKPPAPSDPVRDENLKSHTAM